MKKYCIGLVGVYFGKLPSYIQNFLISCSYNKDIDFLIFTDDEIDCAFDNVKIINIDFKTLKKRIQDKLQMDVSLYFPYKLCDFKPAYGVIFDDYLKKYDFWGHIDLDMIFGDIRHFITDDLLEKYDKLLRWGHLSLYRNTKECNERFKLKGSKCGDYQEVFTNPKNYIFDEPRGIYSIYEYNHFPIYDKIIMADISFRHRRFTLLNDDYKKCIFCFVNGKVFRYAISNGKIKKDEYIYIHFSKRKKMKIFDIADKFYICNDGFIKMQKNDDIKKIIYKYNRYRGRVVENLEYKKSKLQDRISKFKEKRKKYDFE